MSEYLYRVSIDYPYNYKGEKCPVYAVSTSKEAVSKYVKNHLKQGCNIKNVTLCGERLGMNMYHGKKNK